MESSSENSRGLVDQQLMLRKEIRHAPPEISGIMMIAMSDPSPVPQDGADSIPFDEDDGGSAHPAWDANDARRQLDPFAPPAEPCECYCLHCHRTFMSDQVWF